MKMNPNVSYITVLILTGLSGGVAAQDADLGPESVKIGQGEYSPYLDQGYPDRVYFGDTHLHTSYSTDAGMTGTRLGPEDAYRFARGEEVTSSTGVRALAAATGFPCCGRPCRKSWTCSDD